MLLDGARRVRSDADFVFCHQPTSIDGSVSHTGRTRLETSVEERLAIDLDEVGEDGKGIVLTASQAEGTFGDLSGLRLVVLDETNTVLVTCEVQEASTETAMVLAEVYRREGVWKVRSVGQGWDSGVVGWAQDFGVFVEDEPDEEADDASGELAGAEPLMSATAGADADSGFGEAVGFGSGFGSGFGDIVVDVAADIATDTVVDDAVGDVALADAAAEDLVQVVKPEEEALAAEPGVSRRVSWWVCPGE